MSEDTCKVCGKEIEYWSVPKTNGKTRFYAFHVGDTVPAGSVKVDKNSLSGGHRIRRRKELQEACTASGAPSSTPEVVSEIDVLVEPKKQIVKDVPKEVEIIDQKPTVLLTEHHEVPAESVDKPILEIGEMKRNRFAVTGAICRRLTDAGIPDKKISEVRSDLISKGRDFASLINAAAPYVQIQEGGQPLAFN